MVQQQRGTPRILFCRRNGPLDLPSLVTRAKLKQKQQRKQRKNLAWILHGVVQTITEFVCGAKIAALQVLADWFDLHHEQKKEKEKYLLIQHHQEQKNENQNENQNGNDNENRKLKRNENVNENEIPLLPPPEDDRKKTIVLDLDETLIHSFRKEPAKYDFCVVVRGSKYYVAKRPGLELLLEQLSCMYELVLFTASVRDYAEAILDVIDPQGSLITHRLFRDSCKRLFNEYGSYGYVKDLSLLGRDLAKVLIVDDNPYAYQLQPLNAVPVLRFVDDQNDSQLFTVLHFFNLAYDYDDLRYAIRHYEGLFWPVR